MFINRVKPYNPAGRFQTEAESDMLADDLFDFLNKHGVICKHYTGSEDGYDVLVKDILDVIKEK